MCIVPTVSEKETLKPFGWLKEPPSLLTFALVLVVTYKRVHCKLKQLSRLFTLQNYLGTVVYSAV